ncbi:MAG TPA: WecB/TagA/CpsF family glycosyltransferase, partial [Chitinophagaceae bacterium]|nr:WecB/TagA/CpsF family glycosyltransferase [Chitinophagaceae bacterium]
MKRITICNIPCDALTMDQTIARVDEAIQKKEQLHHVVINAAKVVNAQSDKQLAASIVNCDIINADGQSIVWASKLLKRPLSERVAGIDLMDNLVKLAAEKGYKLYLFGAKEEIVSKVAGIYKSQYGSDIIAGFRNGYYKPEEEEEIARQIGASGAHMLFVAITSPKKEIFLNKYKNLIQVPFIMGVGGSFDVVAGFTRRAPQWMQRTGLEWLYRVVQEPGRLWKRYLVTNTAFIVLVMKERLGLLKKQNL